jgi:hypothetical protein
MKIIIAFLISCISCCAQSYNSNIATVSGNWSNCATWGNPRAIYNSLNSTKVINQNVLVTLNQPNVAAKKIVLTWGSKVDLQNNRISFVDTYTDIPCSGTLIDNVIVNLVNSIPNKSLNGFLHGLDDPNYPARDDIRALQPKLFRTSEQVRYDEGYGLTGRVHYVTGDQWNDSSTSNTPYNDISYENYLNALFAWGYNDGAIRPGIVWECWNEPENMTYNSWTISDFHQTYNKFYHLLRESDLGENALAAGPSFGRFTEERMKNFFDYCLANNLEVNVVTWHEIWYPDQDSKPFALIQAHVEYVRNNFMNNPKYAPLKMQSIEINEIIWPGDKNNPAGIIGYLGNLEQVKVDYASRSCWEHIANVDSLGNVIFPIPSCDSQSCRDTSLNDLFTIDFDSENYVNNSNECVPLVNNAHKRKSSWWVHKVYGDGAQYRVRSYNEEAWSTVIASNKIKPYPQSTPTNMAQILFGYSKKYPAPAYLPINGTYKIRVNNVNNMVTTGNTCYIRLLKIPFRAEGSWNHGEDNQELVAPIVLQASTQYTIINNGIDLEIHDIEPEHLYQILISASQF